jgi:hypothetical protein
MGAMAVAKGSRHGGGGGSDNDGVSTEAVTMGSQRWQRVHQ